jgi:5-(carboxyamino)imidazole ribonucleotide synthase
VAPFAVLRSLDDASRIGPGLLPGIVKSARFGYDGKGQASVRTHKDVAAAWRAMKGLPCVLEKRLHLTCEVSVIVARNERGESATWPVAENVHRDGILDVSIVPARISDALTGRARDIATRVAAALDYRGVLCVEMFVTDNDALLVNEIAPRPHNSGHYHDRRLRTSQFRQQARAGRLAAGRDPPAHARGDGEPAGRHLVRWSG